MYSGSITASVLNIDSLDYQIVEALLRTYRTVLLKRYYNNNNSNNHLNVCNFLKIIHLIHNIVISHEALMFIFLLG